MTRTSNPTASEQSLLQLDLDYMKVAALIEEKVGGMVGLMDVWAERYAHVPDRSTFYSWISDGSYSGNLQNYLRLCSCLDVDPLALVSVELLSRKSFGDILLMQALNFRPDRRSRRDGSGRGIKVSDVMGMFGPLPEWPSPKNVLEFFGRDWSRKFFKNEGQKSSRYETIHLSFENSPSPHVVHFAYRVSSAERWRMYGSVESWKGANRLIHFYGEGKQVRDSTPNQVYVETRFGEGACEFCLASLHPFSFALLGERVFVNSLRFSA